MQPFINEDFMLTNDAARELYHGSAEGMPIIDYHCHLSPRMIALDYEFSDITELWLSGDHYKWRAMRGNGIPEELITGKGSSSWEKFQAWARTVPYTMRNPLYHWSHLELSRIFGIDRILKPETARDIFDTCNEMIRGGGFSARKLIKRFSVETLCTTDDPVDDLSFHQQIRKEPFGVNVLPAWRPDRALSVEDPEGYAAYLGRLSAAADMEISSYEDLIGALAKRHRFFERMGCRLSDHGMDTFYSEDYTSSEIDRIFSQIISGRPICQKDILKFKSSLIHDLAVMDAESGWVQQFHVGPIRNNSPRMFEAIGPDTGFDAINDLPVAAAGHRFFGILDQQGKLAKTILYCLNPKDNEVMTTMAYTFNDGSCPGKMQFGAAWWFLDQEDGMRKQIASLSSMGLLSRFVGMLTDSRSFISYPRHEYFRRILCDILGNDIESGRLPSSEMDFIHQMVKDICCNNARDYFRFQKQ